VKDDRSRERNLGVIDQRIAAEYPDAAVWLQGKPIVGWTKRIGVSLPQGPLQDLHRGAVEGFLEAEDVIS